MAGEIEMIGPHHVDRASDVRRRVQAKTHLGSVPGQATQDMSDAAAAGDDPLGRADAGA